MMDERKNVLSDLKKYIPILIILIGIFSFILNISITKDETDNKELGFQKWQENVLKDSSEEGTLLREALNPENPIYTLHKLNFNLKNNATKIFKDTAAAIELSNKIPVASKIVLYEIDKNIKETKEIYSIKFVDEEGNTLKDKNGKEMIYKAGDKIVLSKSMEKYKYVFMRANKEIPFVYGLEDLNDSSKGLDLTTVPITYIDDEAIANTLYEDITILKKGKTKLNIVYSAPLEEVEPWQYSFIFDLDIKE